MNCFPSTTKFDLIQSGFGCVDSSGRFRKQPLSNYRSPSQVKQSMTSDPRYDAVGSSSLRAELFQRHIKNLGTQAESSNSETPEQAAARKAKERKEKAQASLRDRQQQVQGEKMRLERDLQKSKYGAGKEDGEREFGSLLIQAIREHNVRERTDVGIGSARWADP